MAQSGFTPILTYASNTATSVPSAGNLTNSANGAELAVNTADKRLFTKDSGGSVVELGTNPSSVTLSGGTANGVAYLNGSKVLTTGTALTFDGTNLGVGTSSPGAKVEISGASNAAQVWLRSTDTTSAKLRAYINGAESAVIGFLNGGGQFFEVAGTEGMRLTSTGLGIGTSSPSAKLNVVGSADVSAILESTGTSHAASLIARSGNGTTSGLYAYARFVNNDTNAQDWRIGTYGNNNLSIVNAKTATVPVVLDTSGNLGIGTSSPSYKLDVNGAINTSADLISQGSNARLSLYRSTGVNYFDWASGQSLYFSTQTSAGGAGRDTKMTLDSSGNLGLGVTPSSWDNNFKAFQLGYPNFIAGNNGGNRLDIGVNAYFSTNYKYAASSVPATYYSQSSGAHTWYNAPSGTAGNPITFTQAMTLDASGNLAMGSSAATARVVLTQPAGDGTVKVSGDGTNYAIFDYNGSNFGRIGTNTAKPFTFLINSNEVARLDASGRLLVGLTSDTAGGGYFGAIQARGASPALVLSGTEGSAKIWQIAENAGGLYFYNTTDGLRMSLDSSGNLGLGVTPSAWQSAYKALDFGNRGGLATEGTAVQLSLNGYYNAGWKYKQTAAASFYEQYNGTHAWYNAPSGTAGNAITFAQAMTLNATGNLALSTTTPNWLTGGNISLPDTGAVIANGTSINIGSNYYFNAGFKYVGTGAATHYYQNAGSHVWETAPSGIAGNPITFTPAMTLNTASQLLVGTTSVPSGAPSNSIIAAGSVTTTVNGTTGATQFTDSAGTLRNGMYLDSSNLYVYGAYTQGHRWVVQDVEKMRLDSSGNLGIGTSSPGGKLGLDIAATSGYWERFYSSGTELGYWYFDANTLQLSSKSATRALTFLTNDTERMRLDSSGNLGLGVTPSAWTAGGNIQLGVSSKRSITTSGTVINLGTNWYYASGTNDTYIGTGAATNYEQNAGVHKWYNAPSGTAGNAITFTQAMTLDASGNLGIGTTSTSGLRLTVDSGSAAIVANFNSTNANGNYIRFQNSGTSIGDIGAGAQIVSGGAVAGDFGITSRSGNLVFGTSSAERARIDTSGNLLVNAASSGNGIVAAKNSTYCYAAQTTTANTADVYYVNFISSTGAQNGYIYRPTATGTTQLVSASDVRLKKNIVDATFSGLGVIGAVKVREFDWKDSGGHSVGFIAQELHQVCADAVAVGEDNANGSIKRPWAVSREAMVPYLIKAVQEQQALIAKLTDRIAALEARCV